MRELARTIISDGVQALQDGCHFSEAQAVFVIEQLRLVVGPSSPALGASGSCQVAAAAAATFLAGVALISCGSSIGPRSLARVVAFWITCGWRLLC